jgi:plasmid stabilization system protein ParE
MAEQVQSTDNHLVCAVLAAHMEALRDRIDTTHVVDLLWRSTDVMAALSGWIAETPTDDPSRDRQRTELLATAVETQTALDALVFSEAQRQDFARQMADSIMTALDRLAAAPSSGKSLSPNELTAFYVSEDQHALHAAVMQRLTAKIASSPPGAPTDAPSDGPREGRDDTAEVVS